MNRYGEIAAVKFYDIDNTAYYLDPSATTTSLNVAGEIAMPAGKDLVMGGLNMMSSDGTNNYLKTGTNLYLENQTSAIGVIKSDGSLGLGTTTPSTKLEVSGTGIQTIKVTSTDAVQAGIYLQRGTSSDGPYDVHLFNNNGVFRVQSITPSVEERFTILTDGKVGIANATPAAKLSIHEPSSANTYVQITNNSTGTTITDGLILLQGGANSTFINRENGYMSFETNNNEKVRILADGKLGIGTTTPAEMLDVDGNARIQGNISAVEHQMQDSVGVVKAAMKYSDVSKSIKFTFA